MVTNYNTVESVLLGSAVLVCNFGIIFESDFIKRAPDLREGLAYATLTIIGASLWRARLARGRKS